MNDMFAAIEDCYDVVIIRIVLEVDGVGSCCAVSGCSADGRQGRGLKVVVAVQQGRRGGCLWVWMGKWFQTYNALLWLRHDAYCKDKSVTLKETCKR